MVLSDQSVWIVIATCMAAITKTVMAEELKPDVKKEFCNTAAFHPKCEEDEVVIMKQALYGRMRLGDCLTEDFGYLDCSSEVMPEMDSLCSGRRECDVKVDDKTFRRPRPCHKDLKSYLEAQYSCQKVIIPNNDCQFYSKVSVTEQSGYLSSIVTEKTNCGSTDSPWSIKVEPGQRINITLLDFSYFNVTLGKELGKLNPSICKVYATIRDSGTSKRSTTICGGKNRAKHAYLSETNTVEVRILGGSGQHRTPVFLLKYTAMGCPTLEENNEYWVEHMEKEVRMGCKADSTHWTMTCEGNQWAGNMHNCTTVPTPFLQNVVGSVSSIPYALSMVIIIAIAVGVGTAILITGIFCIRWRMQTQAVRERPVASKCATTLPRGYPDDKYVTTEPPKLIQGEQQFRENEYASMRLLPPVPDMGYNSQKHFQHPASARSLPSSHYQQHCLVGSTEHVYESPDSLRRVCPPDNSNNKAATGVLGSNVSGRRVVDNNYEGDNPPQYFDLDPRQCTVATCTGRCNGASGYCTCAQELAALHTGNDHQRKNNEKGTYSI